MSNAAYTRADFTADFARRTGFRLTIRSCVGSSGLCFLKSWTDLDLKLV